MKDAPAPPTVVLASGHMVDAPGRAHPRFPPSVEAPVAAAVAAALDGWGLGPGDVLVCGGARGTDILAAEAAVARGAAVHLRLARPLEAFVDESVRLPASTWERRLRDLLPRADTAVLPPAPGDDRPVWARANLWMLAEARALATSPAHLKVLLVWDGRPGDGPGGTADVAARTAPLGAEVLVVDPAAPERAGRPPMGPG